MNLFEDDVNSLLRLNLNKYMLKVITLRKHRVASCYTAGSILIIIKIL